MRFSLRTLMLIFTAIMLSYGIALLAAQTQATSDSESDFWVRNDLNNVKMQVSFIESQTRIGKLIPNIPRLNQLLHDPNNVVGDPASRLAWPHPCGRRDAWGHLYVAVALDELNRPLPEVVNTNKVGFYSLGQDGKSNSHGNDPDDLNSWSSTPYYYQEQKKNQLNNQVRLHAFWNMPVPLALILGFIYLFRDLHLASKEEPPAP